MGAASKAPETCTALDAEPAAVGVQEACVSLVALEVGVDVEVDEAVLVELVDVHPARARAITGTTARADRESGRRIGDFRTGAVVSAVQGGGPGIGRPVAVADGPRQCAGRIRRVAECRPERWAC
ncbi:hypothetical protein GCM10025780_04370 [Frondihabitans cladoniiphilus]|uniref:Uncharacterized protein n=1 Tax=Frondihabitans cladoniiphilus TaxID=715785 RepID=A0ABP8VML0_9MICO